MEIEESLIWNREALSRSQNLFLACQEIDYLVAFSVFFQRIGATKTIGNKAAEEESIYFLCLLHDRRSPESFQRF